MPSHIVQQGECISSIAFAAGFLPETLWDLPENADLKSLRKDLNILYAGDVVEVPELRLREEDRPTGARHSFVKKGVPALIRLQVFDGEKPRANQQYTLTIDGVQISGTTDAEGKLEHPMPPDARRGELVIGPEQCRYPLDFGHLDPISEITGVQARLNNLGYECGAVDGVCGPRTRRALIAFQYRFKLDETGEPDDATRKKLEEIHDRVSQFPEQPPAQPQEAEQEGDSQT